MQYNFVTLPFKHLEKGHSYEESELVQNYLFSF